MPANSKAEASGMPPYCRPMSHVFTEPKIRAGLSGSLLHQPHRPNLILDKPHKELVDSRYQSLNRHGPIAHALKSGDTLAVHVVRAFRVHEGHRFPHRNGELIRSEKEICEVDRGICFALAPCRARAHGREQRDDFEEIAFHGGICLDGKRRTLFQGCFS